MKSALFIAAAGSAVLVAAQNLTGEPDCAVPCLSSAIAAVCTPASDQGCACASQSAIAQVAIPCLLSGCDASALGQAQTAGAQLCIDYSATAASTTAAASASSSGTTNGTAVLTTTTNTAATATATGSGSGSGTGKSATSASTTSTTRASGATATSASASASSTSSAGAQSVYGGVGAQAGLLGAFLAGVAALL